MRKRIAVAVVAALMLISCVPFISGCKAGIRYTLNEATARLNEFKSPAKTHLRFCGAYFYFVTALIVFRLRSFLCNNLTADYNVAGALFNAGQAPRAFFIVYNGQIIVHCNRAVRAYLSALFTRYTAYLADACNLFAAAV